MLIRQDCRRSLTSKAVDIVFSVNFGEARLVAVSVHGSDPGFPASTALPRGDDRVAHAPVSQPARTAVVQPIVPGHVQLSCGGQLSPVTQTVGLGLPESETLRVGAVEHLTLTKKEHDS